MKKIGLFGGTFNPPHIGHLIMANEVYAALDLTEVRFMPNATAPHKEAVTSATNAQRLKMVELAIQDVPYFSAETFEIERGGVSYTYETMKAMCEREPDVEFYFIIGGDMIDSLHTWYRIDELTELVQFVGVKRPGSEAKPITMYGWWKHRRSIFLQHLFAIDYNSKALCSFYYQRQ